MTTSIPKTRSGPIFRFPTISAFVDANDTFSGTPSDDCVSAECFRNSAHRIITWLRDEATVKPITELLKDGGRGLYHPLGAVIDCWPDFPFWKDLREVAEIDWKSGTDDRAMESHLQYCVHKEDGTICTDVEFIERLLGLGCDSTFMHGTACQRCGTRQLNLLRSIIRVNSRLKEELGGTRYRPHSDPDHMAGGPSWTLRGRILALMRDLITPPEYEPCDDRVIGPADLDTNLEHIDADFIVEDEDET